MAASTRTKKKVQTDVAKLKSQLEKYEAFFDELDQFISFVRDRRCELKDAVAREAQCKADYDQAKANRKELELAIGGAKDALYQMVEPGATEFMPLLDRMEPADPEKHGEHASQWRTEPIAALGLSPNATRFLLDADIVAVGQLQDLVLANATFWWEKIEGLSDAVAAAIVDRLNDFIFRKESGDE